ncbi:hypothetical protein [Pseudomonas protegens]|uniref:hypothetical protein n=1 Tax=Pseudomonas protegens TaxID=380021 RepID=UPI000F4621B8|nr:hypothetical protein [Pseudomonas protegens]ROL86531.1 hypothetical protein BK639_28425 [Pseudomonas protegens]ROL95131.1 hypothetical protein BK640_29015 [Pseudomonas protegens]ROL97880.1 hypothetical protein BK641_27090 [Pseudomonas protegens]ROM07666.1 hypothetical protein BK642_13990 [Pseudomonas protegens]
MPTETQHLEQRVAALHSDLNTKNEQIDALTFSDNDRELSRRDWFDAAQEAEKRVEELRADLASANADKEAYAQNAINLRERVGRLKDQRNDYAKQLAERDALLERCRLAVANGEDFDLPASLLDEIKALSASAEPGAPIAKQELQLEDSERQRLIAWGRNCGLEEASKVCQRMAHEAYYPPGTRFKHFTPKAQMRLGDILIKAANAIGGLPDGPYERFHARQGNKTR